MTVGVYALYWEEQDLVYIGQSINIEKRYKNHINLLSNSRHSNYKVQESYRLYGRPTLYIIETCSTIELNSKEITWTKEFDSLNNGLNIVEAGNALVSSPGHIARKYTEEQTTTAFKYLSADKFHSRKDIANITKISIDTIKRIATGAQHKWLRQKYPEKYNRMLENSDHVFINRNCFSIYYKK